jgi:release factor glutamine methyltransferase
MDDMIVPDVSQALLEAESQGLDRLDAQLLVLHALGRQAHQRGWLLAHATDLIDSTVLQALVGLVKRRAAGEPLAYITGQQAFFGLDLQVDARVLVPRPDTETLVEWALTLLPRPLSQAWGEGLLDLGTGSGAVALAVKSQRPDLRVTALDVSADALAVARSNAERLQLEMHFRQGSWLQGITGRFQIIVSNPPYIAAHDQHLDALSFEPTTALVSGADGLDDIRQIIAQSPRHLLPGGWLLLEHGYDQASAVRHLLEQTGFEQVQSRRDLAGVERCSGGCTATSPATCPGFR